MDQSRLDVLFQKTHTITKEELQEYLKKQYYETSNPIITDEEYDKLFGDNDYVGYTPEQNGPWEVLPHSIAMGSLNKIKTWQQAEDWSKDKGDIIWEPKLDGLSIELVYEKGQLTHAILRGGGDQGEDILKNAKNFIGVLQKLDTEYEYLSVRGEVVISQSNFNTLCKVSNESYSNRRNCVPGICRRYDGQYSEYLSFWAYDVIRRLHLKDDVLLAFYSETKKLVFLHELGFKVPFACKSMTEGQYIQYGDIRDTAEEFQMDGLVLKSDEFEHQIALKFKPKGEQTIVTQYTWDVGSTGKLVPMIWFEPVTIGGTRLTKAAVGSYKGYKDLNASIGSIVEVNKMNDVIPKVTKVISRFNLNVPLETPTVCPVCGEQLKEQGADLYCVNPNCRVKQESKCCAVYWAIGLKGITDSWVKELMKQSQIKKCYDVLTVKPEQIAGLKGYSFDKANKMTQHFKNECRNILFENKIKQLLWMLPIPTVSGKAQEKLAEYFKDIIKFESFITTLSGIGAEDNVERKADLTNLLGNAKGTKAFEYFVENRDDILKLLETMRTIINE